MPALVQPHSIMQEPESLWGSNSFKSSLGKRQREGEDDGRLTSGMFSVTHGFDGGYDGGAVGNTMGITVNTMQQDGGGSRNGSLNRFGMKRLKSTTDQPSSTSNSTSVTSLPFPPNPSPFLPTHSAFASSSTTPVQSSSQFFPPATSSTSSPSLSIPTPTLYPHQNQNHVQTGFGLNFTTGSSYANSTSDYLLATGSLRLENPYSATVYEGRTGGTIPEFDDMEMDHPNPDLNADAELYSAHPNAPPPSLYSMESASSTTLPEPGPSTYIHQPQQQHQQLLQYRQSQNQPQTSHTVAPQTPPSLPTDSLQVGRTPQSVSPNDGYAEPYWRDGIKGLSSIGSVEDHHSPLSDRRGRGGVLPLPTSDSISPSTSREVQQYPQAEGPTGGMGLDLGRSVAMAMGMGVDSRMTHGDVEMDDSPVYPTLGLPPLNPAEHKYGPSRLPTTPIAPHFDTAPSAPVNTPATTPTRQNAVPHLIMTGYFPNKSASASAASRYSMGLRADCDKCRDRVEGHVSHWR